jgi:hypothetical protein
MHNGYWVPNYNSLYDPTTLKNWTMIPELSDAKHLGNFRIGNWVHESENRYINQYGVTIIPGHNEPINIKDIDESERILGWKYSHMEIRDLETCSQMQEYAFKCIDYILHYDKYIVNHSIAHISGEIGVRPHPDNTHHQFNFRDLWKFIFTLSLQITNAITMASIYEHYKNLVEVRANEIIILAHMMKVLDLNIYYNNGDGRKNYGVPFLDVGTYGYNNEFELNIYTKEHNPALYKYYSL